MRSPVHSHSASQQERRPGIMSSDSWCVPLVHSQGKELQGKKILTRQCICASSQEKIFMKAQILSHTFSAVPNEKERQAPRRLETLVDRTSPWLREAVRKQTILLIFNTSYHVPNHARSRKQPQLHHFWQKNLRNIQIIMMVLDSKSWTVHSLAQKPKNLCLSYNSDPTSSYKDPQRVTR